MSSELAAQAGAKLGTIGSAFYFAPATVAVGERMGLDPFQFYAIGRGGVLGDVESPVVQSAFGYFEATTLANLWTSARERTAPREAGAAFMECAREFGRDRFAEIEELDGFCEAARAIVAAVDPAGLALYAATAAEPLCHDIAGRAMQLAVVLREYRGSVHLLAVVAECLAPSRAHYLKRPGDYAMFGHTDEPAPATEAEREAHAAAESRTDAICGEAFACLDDAHRAVFVAGIDAMSAALP
ncbi:MAG: hypothetical protein ACE5GB_07090 [Acidimicrobiales bacterium]